MPRPISYAVLCLKKKNLNIAQCYLPMCHTTDVARPLPLQEYPHCTITANPCATPPSFSLHTPTTTYIHTLSLHDALPICEPLKATSYMAVGFYVAKYVNKKSDMDLAAKGLGAKE